MQLPWGVLLIEVTLALIFSKGSKINRFKKKKKKKKKNGFSLQADQNPWVSARA